MASTLSQIPELRYDDLIAEARGKLPALCPEWTDHGPGDVGITLIELFAWLVEMIRYRTRRETEALTRVFLELLAGSELAREPDLGSAMRRALAQIWTCYRAVTPQDYEALLRDEWPASPEAAAIGKKAPIHRAVCLPERDLEGGDALTEAPDHVTLVVLPKSPSSLFQEAIRGFFEPRRILTTRVHVVSPSRLKTRIDASLYLEDDVTPATVRARAEAALTQWFDPYVGGVDGDGWPFGADVYHSDVYALLDAVPGVDFVDAVDVRTNVGGHVLTDDQGARTGILLHPHQMVLLELQNSVIRLFEPTTEGWKEVVG